MMANNYFNEDDKIQNKKLLDFTDREIESLLTSMVIYKSGSFRPLEQNFNKQYDFVFAGCSQTHGDHISPPLAPEGSHENIWGFLVAKYFNLETINLGMGADSCYNIVKRLMHHFSLVGNPKTLAVLFPDLYRLTLPIDEDVLIGKRPSGINELIESVFLSEENSTEISKPKYSKIPYYKEEVISNLTPLWLNIQSILILEQYCKSSGIKLIYGSWYPDTELIINKIKIGYLKNYGLKIFQSYVDLDALSWEKSGYLSFDCHEDLLNQNTKIFNLGSDGQHMGTHRHKHISEIFIKELENDIN
jgi:hypothetical protein